jgi:hypothetical protein
VDELRQLIEAARTGKRYKSMTGPMRALCYRLAVNSGLRYSEIGSIFPESFDWNSRPASVTVRAAYAKNGKTATLPILDDLASDVRAYLADVPNGKPIFPLPHDKGAAMIQTDLAAAGIAYEDASGRFFDFHSLRCELATLANAAGVSPRVVQRMMRHSKLEMTGRYTRPRAVDIEAAAAMLPSLKTDVDHDIERAIMTRTDSSPISILDATENATTAAIYAFKPRQNQAVASNPMVNVNPLVEGSSPSPVICNTSIHTHPLRPTGPDLPDRTPASSANKIESSG